MQLSGLHFGATKTDTVLLVDLGSAAVRLARTHREKRTPVIDETLLADMPFRKTLTAAGLKKSALTTLLQALLDLPDKESCGRCNITLGPPWYESRLRDVQVSRLSQSLPAELEHERLSLSKHIPHEEEVVDIEPSSIHARGYRVTEDTPVWGAPLTIRWHITTAPANLMQELRETIGSFISPEHIRFRTHASLLSGLVCQAFPDTDTMVVHVTGEITEILLLREGALVGSETFPSGIRRHIRAIEQKSNASAEEIASWFTLFSEHKLSATGLTKQRLYMEEEANLFAKALEVSGRNLAGVLPPPSRVLLSAPAMWQSWYTRIIKKTWQDYGISAAPEVVSLESCIPKGAVECTGGVCDNRVMLSASTLL